MHIITSLNPLLVLFSFFVVGFLGILAGVATAVAGVVASGKTKSATKIAAANAAKQRAHDKLMAEQVRTAAAKASVAAAEKRKSNLLLVSLAGGSAVMAVFIFKQ